MVDNVPDIRLALQRRGGAYRRPGSTVSAPPEVSTPFSPLGQAKDVARAGLGLLRGIAGLKDIPGESDDADQVEPNKALDDSATTSRTGSLLGLSLFSPVGSGTEKKSQRRQDDRLRPRFQARGGVVARPEPASPASLAPVKEEEVEPYLDSMETEARAALAAMEDLTTMDLSDGERSPPPSDETVADFELESVPLKRTEVREADDVAQPASSDVRHQTQVPPHSQGSDQLVPSVPLPPEDVARLGREGSAAGAEAPAARVSDADVLESEQQGCDATHVDSALGTPQGGRSGNGKFRDLREFWSKSSVGFAGTGQGKELSLTEAQAKLQRLTTSSTVDLNEVRKLRKRLSLHGTGLTDAEQADICEIAALDRASSA